MKLSHSWKHHKQSSKFDIWKIQLTIAINYISSKDIDEERVMQSKSDNMEIISQDEVDEVIEETFEQSLSRYQIGLEKSMKDSDFIFDCINLLYYVIKQILIVVDHIKIQKKK